MSPSFYFLWFKNHAHVFFIYTLLNSHPISLHKMGETQINVKSLDIMYTGTFTHFNLTQKLDLIFIFFKNNLRWLGQRPKPCWLNCCSSKKAQFIPLYCFYYLECLHYATMAGNSKFRPKIVRHFCPVKTSSFGPVIFIDA